MRAVTLLLVRIGFIMLTAALVSCGGNAGEPAKGRQQKSMTASDGESRAFVWLPESGGGATQSQPFEVWIQYLESQKPQGLVFKAIHTAGVRLKWVDARTLEICYGVSHILYMRNFFDYAEEDWAWRGKPLYSVEVLLKRVPQLADCGGAPANGH
jgi:hypothetical protein